MGDEPPAKKRKLENQELCPICFDPYNTGSHKVVSLRCGHIFGHSCLKAWLRGRDHKNCPICRRRAVWSHAHPVYAEVLVGDTEEPQLGLEEVPTPPPVRLPRRRRQPARPRQPRQHAQTQSQATEARSEEPPPTIEHTRSSEETSAADVRTRSPEESSSTSEVPTRTSQVPTRTSEVPARPSEVPTRTSEVPTRPSEVPTRTSEVPTRTSEVATRTSVVRTRRLRSQSPKTSARGCVIM